MPDQTEGRRDIYRAGRAIDKVLTQGNRGATLVSTEEVEAMVKLLAEMGLEPIPAGRTVEDPIFVSARFHPQAILKTLEDQQ